MKISFTPLQILIAAAVAVATPSITRSEAISSSPPYEVQKTLSIGGAGRWDYATFDPQAHRLYVTRSTHTQVIDAAAGKVVLDIPGQLHSHGVAAVPSVQRGFITDGGAGRIVIFDLRSGRVLGRATAASDADGEIYDPGSDRVLVTCGDAGKLAVLKPDIDPNGAKADLIDLGGSPEFLAADGAGKAYVNLNDRNQVAVVDLKTMTVVARWPIGTGAKPTGLAIDPARHRLFVGCRNQKLIVMSAETGRVLAELPIGGGVDACAFDPGTNTAFASCGDGTLTVVTEKAGGFRAESVSTRPGARTMALDPITHVVYLPAAELTTPAGEGSRPQMKPGSFGIVVVTPTASH